MRILMKKLTLFINEEVVYEYNREITFEQQQLEFLDKMDKDMEKGIKIRGEFTIHPDLQQRTTFIVMNLIKALQQDNDAVIAASCAYLANRHPELIEVHANDHDDTIRIELVNE